MPYFNYSHLRVKANRIRKFAYILLKINLSAKRNLKNKIRLYTVTHPIIPQNIKV